MALVSTTAIGPMFEQVARPASSSTSLWTDIGNGYASDAAYATKMYQKSGGADDFGFRFGNIALSIDGSTAIGSDEGWSSFTATGSNWGTTYTLGGSYVPGGMYVPWRLPYNTYAEVLADTLANRYWGATDQLLNPDIINNSGFGFHFKGMAGWYASGWSSSGDNSFSRYYNFGFNIPSRAHILGVHTYNTLTLASNWTGSKWRVTGKIDEVLLKVYYELPANQAGISVLLAL